MSKNTKKRVALFIGNFRNSQPAATETVDSITAAPLSITYQKPSVR